jgi:hypothetical protein
VLTGTAPPAAGTGPQTAGQHHPARPANPRHRDGSRHRDPGRAASPRPAAALTLAACAVLGVLGLLAGGPVPGRMLPASQAGRVRAAAVVVSPSATAAVIAAYTAYFPALLAAEPLPQARAAAMLAPYAAQPYLGHVLAQIAAYQANDEVSWGSLVPHVTSVQVSGNQAVVRDCQDASSAWLVSSATGRVIPGTTGYARTSLVAALARGSDGRWRLTFLGHLTDPCEPVPSPS